MSPLDEHELETHQKSVATAALVRPFALGAAISGPLTVVVGPSLLLLTSLALIVLGFTAMARPRSISTWWVWAAALTGTYFGPVLYVVAALVI
jgi:hypothetical protein